MSNRFYEFDKGSSRSARDDSRHKGRDHDKESKDKRARSRSPRRSTPPSTSRKRHTSDKSPSRGRDYEERSSRKKSSHLDPGSDEEVPAPPPPPRISKITIGFTKPKAPIKMSIGGAKVEKPVAKPTVASVFNTDDDDEPEEMPAEAKMRMRNIGRETPTSAGPNSFGKTKQGFCDAKKVFEKNLKHALETEARPVLPKFPQTIYKIKPSS